MSSTFNSESEKAQPMIYQIRIKGHLGHEWADWFEGLTLTALDNGETLLTGMRTSKLPGNKMNTDDISLTCRYGAHLV